MPLHGDRLRRLRQELSYTQEQLAERLSLGIRQIHRYEKGLSDPAGDIVARIAVELEVTTDYLLGLIDEPTRYYQEKDLTPQERKLLSAFRRRDTEEILQILAAEFGAPTDTARNAASRDAGYVPRRRPGRRSQHKSTKS
jgi:transcriptional regulator with XRE-family HTH domain